LLGLHLVILVIYGMIRPSAGQARAKEELRKARELGGSPPRAGWGVAALVAFLYDWDTWYPTLGRVERSLR